MSSSPRVRLEVEFLDAEQAAPAPLAPVVAGDERMLRTVFAVAGEADFRKYVRECLRERTDLRVLEAATVGNAVALAAQYPPTLLIVDEPESAVVATLSQVPAIIVVDDVPRGEQAPGPRLLARPFTAEGLVAEVDQLLAAAP